MPGGPLNVVVPVAGGIAYVGTKAGTIVAIDLGTHKVLGTLLQRNGPIGAMDYDAVTGQVYAPVASANAVEVLRPASPAGDGGASSLPTEPLRTLPFAGGPDAVAITFDGAYGFVAERSHRHGHDARHLGPHDACDDRRGWHAARHYHRLLSARAGRHDRDGGRGIVTILLLWGAVGRHRRGHSRLAQATDEAGGRGEHDTTGVAGWA